MRSPSRGHRTDGRDAVGIIEVGQVNDDATIPDEEDVQDAPPDRAVLRAEDQPTRPDRWNLEVKAVDRAERGDEILVSSGRERSV